VLAVLVGLGCLGLSAYLYSAYRSESRLGSANDLGRQGRYREAATLAAGIRTAPTVARAEVVVAYADLAAGNLPAADAAFARAAAQSPRDWALRTDWATTLLRRGRRGHARAEMALALSLNPRLQLPRGFCPVPRRAGHPGAGVALCRGG
jgi:Flp pilus assembly protein TadD